MWYKTTDWTFFSSARSEVPSRPPSGRDFGTATTPDQQLSAAGLVHASGSSYHAGWIAWGKDGPRLGARASEDNTTGSISSRSVISESIAASHGSLDFDEEEVSVQKRPAAGIPDLSKCEVWPGTHDFFAIEKCEGSVVLVIAHKTSESDMLLESSDGVLFYFHEPGILFSQLNTMRRGLNL